MSYLELAQTPCMPIYIKYRSCFSSFTYNAAGTFISENGPNVPVSEASREANLLHHRETESIAVHLCIPVAAT